MNGKPNTMKS